MIRRLPVLLISLAVLSGKFATAQLNINGAQFFIEAGATVTVQGNLTSNMDIQGTGKILLKGSSLQNIDMGDKTIPNLEIDNPANAALLSLARIGNTLTFTNGKIMTGNFDLRLSDVATTSGGGTSKFVETNGTGKLLKALTANVTGYEMPVGSGTSYNPVFLTTSGTYSNAVAGVQAKPGASLNKHPRSTEYLNTYWTLTRSGITGTMTAAGQYSDPGNLTLGAGGAETDLRGFMWNGTTWMYAGSSIDYATNRVTGTITADGELFAMNRFNLLKAKAFLQGAFPVGATVMVDNLRAGTNVIPLTDPYRAAPYNANFTHVANTDAEVAAASVFNDLANDNNIVDWVFLELRNNADPGNVVLQTRSGLIQKDGDIVDVDGVSPVYFKNVDPGNYTIAVRHRNHLGISTDPTTNQRALSEQTPGTITDFSTFTASQIYKNPAVAGPSFDVMNGKNVLFGGNANHNTISRYGLANNDRQTILQDLSNNENGFSVAGYWRSDLNMNRVVRYGLANNDRQFLLATVLANGENTVRTQQLPQ